MKVQHFAFSFCAIAGAIAVLAQLGAAPPASQESQGATGPLKLVVRMSKPTYFTNEMVVAHATLTNTSSSVVSVYKPRAPYTMLYSLDGVEIVRGRMFRTVSLAGPSPGDIIRLAPNQSVTTSMSLSTDGLESSIEEGTHTLTGRYTTSDLRLGGIWVGEVETSALAFKVVPPTGSEEEAHDLYGTILSARGSGFYPENYEQVKQAASNVLDRFPQSVYVPCALWKTLPQLNTGKRHREAIDLASRYFALQRSDDPYFIKGIARFNAEAHHQLGEHRKALAVLDKYVPGEPSVIRRQIETALRSGR